MDRKKDEAMYQGTNTARNIGRIVVKLQVKMNKTRNGGNTKRG